MRVIERLVTECSISQIDTSMTYCPLITLTLKIISVGCIPLNFSSKTRRRATLLLPTWIYSCQSVGTVNFTLPFTTSGTISVPEQKHSIFARLWRFYLNSSDMPGLAPLKCFILRAVRLSNKLLGQGYVKERLSSMVGMGILSNNMRSPSPECYTTFWMMTIYSDTLHWSGITPILDPITDLDLITEFDFLPNWERFP